jgi:hypothetical protein
MRGLWLHPSVFWPGKFWIKSFGLTGEYGVMLIGKPRQWSFVMQDVEEYAPFESEEEAARYAVQLAGKMAAARGWQVQEGTYHGKRAWWLK